MDNLVKISAIAITLNEESLIEKFIDSLGFVDEIIILDSYSSDHTAAIASQNKKVTVHYRKFDNFSNQKNYALSKANNDWVVFFDPDEEVSESLSAEILNTVKEPKAVAYFVKRSLVFMGKQMKYSGFQTDWVVRLFNRQYNAYDGNLVHELIVTNGKTGKLKNKLLHHTYKSFDDYTAKLHRYSSLQAKMLYEKGVRPNMIHFLFRPWYRFWHQYIIRLGILDGKEGFILAYINAFSVFKRYTNLWLLYRKIN